MRVRFKTLGCKVNQYDTAVMRSILESRGYDVVENGPADAYVINTCAVTQRAEAKSRQIVRRVKRENPAAVVVMTGCFPQVFPHQLTHVEGIDALVGVGEEDSIADVIEEAAARRARPDHRGPILKVTRRDSRWATGYGIPSFAGHARAMVKIQEGCAEFCSYCIVPHARGRQAQRPFEDVVREADVLVRSGFKEIVLVGTRLGVYKDLVKLLRVLEEIPGLERIRLSSIEPMDVTPELIEVVAGSPKVCRHLHLPLQSGSERVLQRMGRRYSPAEFLSVARRAKEMCPEIGLTTDVIVGFPGETEEDFWETYKFVREVGFSRLHVFRYSKRPGTRAAEMPDQVGASAKEERARRLRRLGERLAIEFHKRFVGEKVLVLVEGPAGTPPGHPESFGGASQANSGPDRGTPGVEGLTDNYIRVWFPGGESLRNHVVPVRAKEAFAEGLLGEVASDSGRYGSASRAARPAGA